MSAWGHRERSAHSERASANLAAMGPRFRFRLRAGRIRVQAISETSPVRANDRDALIGVLSRPRDGHDLPPHFRRRHKSGTTAWPHARLVWSFSYLNELPICAT